MNGQFIEYYQEGILWRESNYINGHLEGVVKTYYPDGKIKMESPFDIGHPEGVEKTYFPDGKVSEETTYKHGKKAEGSVKKFDEKGNLVKE